MSSNDIEEIEVNIQHAKEIVALGTALNRLLDNRDFKAIILDGYLEKEAVRLVHAKADHNMQESEMQRSIIQQIDAIGSLTHYFNKLRQQASMAESAILSDQETREELLAEGLEA